MGRQRQEESRMTREELWKMAEKYQAKADRDYQAYQETGESRHGSSRRRNEDMAEALRMAAGYADEHQEYVMMRGDMADAVNCAVRISRATGDDREALITFLVNTLITYGHTKGFI